jgi:hypothetical protein
MTNRDTDARVKALVTELVDSSPAAPPFADLGAHGASQRRPRNVATIVATVVVLAGLVTGVAILNYDRSTSGPSTQVLIATSQPDRALLYLDLSKPPPLRITAGDRSVDISTVLGCWFHVPGDAAGYGVGICADGVPDPSRFRLNVVPGQRVVLRLPIGADVSAYLAKAPQPPPPHALATLITNKSAVQLRRVGNDTWSFTFPGSNFDLALLIDIHTQASIVRGVQVSGDASYAATLTTIQGPKTKP